MKKTKKYLAVLLMFLFIFTLTGCKSNTEADVEKNKTAKENKLVDETVTPTQAAAPTPVLDTYATLFDKLPLTKSFKNEFSHNPLISQRFGADPYAMVYGDRVYVYMTNDSQEYDSYSTPTDNTYGKIKTLNCISSSDMVNWTDHGIIEVGGPTGAARWAGNSWAPAAAHKTIDGKEQFFLYFANSAGSIGVLVSDTPYGPFRDALGKPLITKQTPNCAGVVWLFDPAVLVDDDGKAYLYFGGGVPGGREEMPLTSRVVELGEDMMSLAGTPEIIEAPYIFEDSGINKIGDTYYYSYCTNWADRSVVKGQYVTDKAEIVYMTSKNPLGPWEYKGSILKNPGTFFGSWSNNHHSMINFKDQWYIFYHTLVLQNSMQIKGGYRSTHIDSFNPNADGSLPTITATRFGVKQIANVDPYNTNEAETMAWNAGITTKSVVEESINYGIVNRAIDTIEEGDWIGVTGVDFGNTPAKTFTAKVASTTEGNVIKICADSKDGDVIGYLEVPNTGSEDTFTEVTVNISEINGVHDLYFVFAGEQYLFDSWSFGK